MANVANTVNTGPSSKDTVSGGTKFPMNNAMPINKTQAKLGTSSEQVKSSIMSTRFAGQGETFGTNNEVLKKKPN